MQGNNIWPECLRRLGGELPEGDLVKYLRPLHAETSAEGLKLLAPNEMVRKQVRDVLGKQIQRIASEILGYDATLSISIGTSRNVVTTTQYSIAEGPPAAAVAVEENSNGFQGGKLNANYTLNAFIEGKSNSHARAAAQYVADMPGGQYNPLLIYGDTGLGKTHLMHGVGHAILARNPKARVLYMGAEQWLNHFTQSIKAGTVGEFKNHYRTADALLIDDIHFIANKDRTQEEFFHTFNALIEAKSQIVLTCDRYPKELDGLDDRLKTRFAWGLSVPVEPPDLETRAAILIAKAEGQGLKLMPEVALLIARRVRSNVRELEGALNRLVTVARLTGSPVTTDFATECLRDMFAVYDRAVTLENIKKEVASYYNIPVRDFMSKRRTQSLARPRQVAMTLAKELTSHSLSEIGDAFDRDHTTVMHAHDKITELKISDARIREDYANLLRKLQS